MSVEWSVAQGSGTLDRSVSITGPDGTALSSWTLGDSFGTQEVVAAASPTATVSFAAEAALVGSWERMPDLIYPVRAAAVTTDGTRLYVIGGSVAGGTRTRHLQIFDPASDAWSLGVPAPKPLEWTTAVFAEGQLHLLGGVLDDRAATDEHWIYDPATDRWSNGPNLPAPSAGSASGLQDGRIIVAGGIDGPGAYSDNVHFFDPTAGAWSSGPPTPGRLINWQGAVIDDVFYVAGGSGPGRVTSSSLAAYDAVASTWSSLPPMLGPNEGYAGAQFMGLYCVLGGRTTPSVGTFNTPFDRVECYHPGDRRWMEAPALPVAAQEVGAASIGGFLYALGGRPTSSTASPLVYRLGPSS